jgi:hypothetical protein
MISERDYDTPIPSEFPNEANELWTPHSSLPRGVNPVQEPPIMLYLPTNSHAIACFAASARLCESFLDIHCLNWGLQ